MIEKDILKEEALKNEVVLDDCALDRFDMYAELLVYWNEKINLTAITDPEGILYKHFLDSIMILKYVDIKENAKLIDVGTGAGFPGLALKIARPDIDITLMDSTKKKLNVVADIAEKLNLTVNIIHARAEEIGKQPKYRENFDFVTARAVTNLRDLSEICLPFTRKNGFFIPLKSAGTDEEVRKAHRAISILGGKIIKTDCFNLKECGERTILHIEKISQTPSKYPRPSAQIAKNPLV